jgi:hypothetical protein
MTRTIKGLLAVIAAALGLAIAVPQADAANTASISGTVRLAGTGDPAADVQVSVARLETSYDFIGRPVKVPMFFAGTTSDPDGHYTVSGLPASDSTGYWVCFIVPGFPPTYEPECYANQGGLGLFPNPFGWLDFPDTSNNVRLKAGQHIADIDAALFPPILGPVQGPRGAVTGKVTDAFGLPLRFVKITAWNSANRIVGNAATDTKGTYRLEHLLTGSYKLCFDGSNATGGVTLRAFKSRCYATAAWVGHEVAPAIGARPVSVTDGATTAGINTKLAASLT